MSQLSRLLLHLAVVCMLTASGSSQVVDAPPNGFTDLSTETSWLDVYLFSNRSYEEIRLSLVGTGYRLATRAEVETMIAAEFDSGASSIFSFGDAVSGPVTPTLCCRQIQGWYDDTTTGISPSAAGLASVFYVFVGNDLTYSVVDDSADKTQSSVFRGAWVVESGEEPSDLGPHTKDFDSDSQPEKIVWREQSGVWFIRLSSDPSTAITYQWGLPGDRPLVGDYDGDKRPDLAVWRPSNGTWYVLSSSALFKFGPPIVKQFGLPGDIPLQVDFNQDGRLDFAVWRPSNGSFYYLDSSGATIVDQWGLPGDVPLSGAPRP